MSGDGPTLAQMLEVWKLMKDNDFESEVREEQGYVLIEESEPTSKELRRRSRRRLREQRRAIRRLRR